MLSVDRAQVPIDSACVRRIASSACAHFIGTWPSRGYTTISVSVPVAAIAVWSSQPWPSGVLLRLSLFVRGREAMSDELLSVRFDEPLIDELMRFGQAQ